MIIKDLISKAVQEFGEDIFIVDKGIYRRKEYSYKDVYDMSRAICGLLAKLGVKKGDKVLIYLPNGSEYVSVLWACALSGVIAVPIDFNYNLDFVDKINKIVKGKYVFCSVYKSPLKSEKIFIEELSEFYDKFKDYDVKERIGEEDIFEVVYTSGTTSEPKGAIIKNKNLVANIVSARTVINKSIKGYSFLSILPLSHLFEQNIGMFMPMLFGAKLVYISSRKSSTIINCLNEERIRIIVSVPLFLDSVKNKIEKIAREEKKIDKLQSALSRFEKNSDFFKRIVFRKVLRKFRYLDFFVVGGAALDVEVEKFWRGLGIKIFQGYGLTESAPILSCNSFNDAKIGTVGKPIPGVELKIVDGEIIAKGDNVFSGYYEDEKETNKVLKDGWLYTGDLGEFDSEGFLRITGRKKNMILSSSGLNIYPEDIERVLNNFPEVRDSVVLGLDNGKKLVGVLLMEKKVDLDDLLKKANKKLEPHQYLNSLVLWKEKDFPRTPTLKIKRRDVQEGLKYVKNEKRISDDVLINLISEVCDYPISKIKENSLLRDAGLDSIRRIELAVKVEETFDVDFNEDEINEKTKISDLWRLVSSAESIEIKSGLNFFNSKYFIPLRVPLQWFFFLMTKTIYSLNVKGLENLEELDKIGEEFIVIANHSSMFDSFTVLRALPFKYRIKIFIAGAKDYFFRPESRYGRIMGTFGRVVLNAFAFSRDKEIKQSLKDFGRVINGGGSVLIYPEGTRSETGNLSRFKQGIGLLAWHMDVPVIPIKMKGMYNILPKGKSIPRRGNVEVVIGKPIKFSRKKSFRDITEELEKEMREL